MTVRVKICGITNADDARMAVEAGADALGFVFAPSPRRVSPARVAAIVRELPPFVTTVGVIVDEPVEPILAECPLDLIQVHGAWPPRLPAGPAPRLVRALHVRGLEDLRPLAGDHPGVCAFLLDAYVEGASGGTGRTFDWSLARAAMEMGPPVILAGGLNARNVAAAVRQVRPWAVDVSSGVEAAPGRKDPAKVRRFIAAAKHPDEGAGRLREHGVEFYRRLGRAKTRDG